MNATMNQKAHAVCIPFPSQGHINSMLQLAKLLHSQGIHITFVHTEFNYNRVGEGRLASSVDDFRFETIPDGLPPSSGRAPTDLPAICSAIRSHWSAPFGDLVKKLFEEDDEPSSSVNVPPPSCIISDIFTSFTIGIAEEFSIPCVFFCSFSACGYMSSLHIKDLVEKGLVPLGSKSDLSNGYLDTPVDWIPGLTSSMRLKHQNGVILTTDPNDILLNFVQDELQESFRATAIIVNTFDDLEGEVLDAMSKKINLPPIYPIGPLTTACHRILDTQAMDTIGSSSLWKEDSGCFSWLEGRTANSVVYVNFGSLALMSIRKMMEFAWGLADSGYAFVWVIRPGIVKGTTDSVNLLPEEFLKETRGRGLVMEWAPQEEVLRHRSIGGFFTHCGWNSVMESVSYGVPMICWPLFAEQQVNCLYVCDEWGVGIRINDSAVKRGEVAKGIRELMGEENTMRKRAFQWKESASRATQRGGKSFENFEKVVKEVILGGKERNGTAIVPTILSRM